MTPLRRPRRPAVAERILLVGMMGAGKSTAGRLAAKRLGWTWVDVDAEIVRAGGATVPELFARHGEAHFRQEESRVLGAVLERDEPLVISVGGGVVLDPVNRVTLRGDRPFGPASPARADS